MFKSALKKQTSDCCSMSLNPISNLEIWNHGGKKEKRKAILLFSLNC